MTAPAAKFGSAATAAPVNCGATEVFDDDVVEVMTMGVVAGGGELDWTAAGEVVVGMDFGGGEL
jgi:hypothetical protein